MSYHLAKSGGHIHSGSGISSIVIEGLGQFNFFKCMLKKTKPKKQSYYSSKSILIRLHSKTKSSLQNYFSMTKFAFKK